MSLLEDCLVSVTPLIIIYFVYKLFKQKRFDDKYLKIFPGPKPLPFIGNAPDFMGGTADLRKMLLQIVLLTITLVMVSAYHLRKKRDSRYLQEVPGPRPHIIFGNLLDFVGGSAVILRKLNEFTRQYGRIVKVHDGPFSRALIISDVKFLEYIMSSTKTITKAYQYDFFHEWLGTGLLTSTGVKWKKRRRMLTPSFHFSILDNFVEVFESVGDVFVDKLDRQVGSPSFNVYPLVSLCTLDIICEASMGVSINALTDGSSEYVRSVKAMCQIPVDRTFDFTAPFQPWIHPFTPNYFKEKRCLKVLHDHTDKVIDNRIKNPVKVSDDEKDAVGLKRRLAFLDLLLNSTIDGQPLTRMDIREEVDTFMFEGHDTTSSAITFALYSLALHPDIQNKVVEEQKSIFGGKKKRKATSTDLADMKYLESVIKETLRLYPSVPWIGRKFTEEFEWEGTLYPKGLNVLLYIYGTQRDPKNFPDPEKFIPERFLDAELPNPFAYVPFSAGPRNCIGQKFAMMEMKSTISKVIRHFELLPATPEHKLQLAAEAILVSKNGVNISLKRRD